MNGFNISPFQVVCGICDSAATRGLPLEKNFDLKCLQVNVLKNVTRMTERGGGIGSDVAAVDE